MQVVRTLEQQIANLQWPKSRRCHSQVFQGHWELQLEQGPKGLVLQEDHPRLLLNLAKRTLTSRSRQDLHACRPRSLQLRPGAFLRSLQKRPQIAALSKILQQKGSLTQAAADNLQPGRIRAGLAKRSQKSWQRDQPPQSATKCCLSQVFHFHQDLWYSQRWQREDNPALPEESSVGARNQKGQRQRIKAFSICL